jgi:hypothetical protein
MVPYGGRMVLCGGRMVLYGGRMVLWLCFVVSTAVLFARDVGIGMLLSRSVYTGLYIYFYIYISMSNEKWTCL